MSERKYQTRPPLRELDLAYNPNQPRDSHGRWVKAGATEVISKAATEAAHAALVVPKPKTGPSAKRRQMWKAAALQVRQAEDKAITKAVAKVEAKKVAPAVPLKKTKGRLVKKEVVAPEPKDLRHLRKLSAEAQAEVFKEAGLDSKFPGVSTEDLLKKWHEPGHTQEERLAYLEEIERREKQLQVVRQAMHQSLKDFAREGKRDAWRKFDQNLRNLPGGKAIINMRERLLKDKWLDKQEVLSEWFHHHGKHYAGHVLTVVTIASVLHPLGLAAIGGLGAAGVLNVPGADEAFTALMENIWVHSGLATALAPVADKLTGPAFDWLSKERKVERAKRYAAKHQIRPLHV